MLSSWVLRVLTFSALITAINCASEWRIGQRVETSSGIIQGHAASFSNEASEYLGIPNAAPPVGQLRFAAPQAYVSKREQLFVANKYSPDCPTNLPGDQFPINETSSILAKALLATDQHGDTISEDCLTLNIWTKPQSGERSKAVLLWIYGGGFTVGYSASPGINGARLAREQDIIVVTINYRVNIFGFPSNPSSSVAPNAGLLDQRLAVKWVQKNIAAFGGDPSRITIAGQSAGAASVALYAYAWTKNAAVNGFIAESGAVVGNGGPRLGNTSDSWFAVSNTLGCSDGTAVSTVACMRTKDMKQILKAVWDVGANDNLTAGFRINFGPYIDNVTVFGDYNARAAAGNFIHRPMLTGNNDNEGGFSSVLQQLAGGPPLTAAQLAVQEHRSSCSAGATASYVAAAGRLAPGVGAYHTAEVPLVFGTSEWTTNVTNTKSQVGLEKTMMGAWAAFVKDPKHGLKSIGWPVYDPNRQTLIRLAFNNETSPTFVQGNMYDGLC